MEYWESLTPKFTYVIPILNRWLLYAPFHRVSALLNSAAVSDLKENHKFSGDNTLSELRKIFLEEPEEIPEPPLRPPVPEFLGLIPTRTCNLSCVYCDFGASSASKQTMALDVATTVIDWMASCMEHQGKDALEIHFFGGEPFSAPEVVEVAVHRGRAVAAQRALRPRFEVATNGVFSEKRARWVGDYFDAVVLSFDGWQEIHDRQRPTKDGGSFTAVAHTAAWLSQSPVELCFRVCVTESSVQSLPEMTQWFCQTFSPDIINFETLVPTVETRSIGLLPPDPYIFAKQYLQSHRVAATYGIQTVYAAAIHEKPRYSFCPVGKDTLIVAPDGRISACYQLPENWQVRGLDLDFGRVSTQQGVQLDPAAMQRLRELVIDKPRCQGCFCQWSCAGGCHLINSYPGCSQEYSDYCLQTRLVTACDLLEELKCEHLVNELLEDSGAMAALALQPSDYLYDWQGNLELATKRLF